MILELIMPRYTEDDIVLGLQAIANGMNLREASREWGVPYSTLRGRLIGGETHSNAAES